MKQQTTALLLSALLLSTFAHEHLSRSHDQQQQRLNNGFHARKASGIATRDESAEDGQCGWVCPRPDPGVNGDGDGGLTVVVNVTTNIIVIMNTTAQVAWAVEVTTGLVAIFNGSSRTVVLVDIESGTGVYIKNWKYHGEFIAYITSITSLTEIYKTGIKTGIHFDRSNVTREVLEVVGGVLIHLSARYELQFRNSFKGSFKALIEISSRFTVLFKGTLKGFMSLVKTTSIKVRGDFFYFIGVWEGFGGLVKHVQGGIKVLIERSVKFDLSIIFTNTNGVEVFIYIATQISAKLGAASLKGFLGSLTTVFTLIAKFGGNISGGYIGFVKVVGAIIGAVRRKVTIQVLINYLIEYSVSSKTDVSIQEQWSASLKLLIQFVSKLNANDAYSGLLKDLQELRDGKLVINGVKISEIISILVKVGRIAALELIIRVFLVISRVIKIEISMAYLLLALFTRLNTVSGVLIVTKIIPNLNIDPKILESGSSNLLRLILKGVNVGAISKLLEGDVGGIPVIGVIYRSISVTLKSASNGKYELSVILRSITVIKPVGKIVATLTSACKDGKAGGDEDDDDGDDESDGKKDDEGEDDEDDGDNGDDHKKDGDDDDDHDDKHDDDDGDDDDDDDNEGGHKGKHGHKGNHGHGGKGNGGKGHKGKGEGGLGGGWGWNSGWSLGSSEDKHHQQKDRLHNVKGHERAGAHEKHLNGNVKGGYGHGGWGHGGHHQERRHEKQH